MGGEVGSFFLLWLLHNGAGDPSFSTLGSQCLLFFVKENGMAGGLGYLPEEVSTVGILLPISASGDDWAASSSTVLFPLVLVTEVGQAALDVCWVRTTATLSQSTCYRGSNPPDRLRPGALAWCHQGGRFDSIHVEPPSTTLRALAARFFGLCFCRWLSCDSFIMVCYSHLWRLNATATPSRNLSQVCAFWSSEIFFAPKAILLLDQSSLGAPRSRAWQIVVAHKCLLT